MLSMVGGFIDQPDGGFVYMFHQNYGLVNTYDESQKWNKPLFHRTWRELNTKINTIVKNQYIVD